MRDPNLLRRRLLLTSLALPVLHGCAAPLSTLAPAATTTAEAQALLMASATAHGLQALASIRDVSVSYVGKWRTVVGKLQPILVDADFRGGSQERWLLPAGLVAQAHTGPGGHKQVVRHQTGGAQGDVKVWFNDREAMDRERRDAAALVVDGYSLFLLGPMLLAAHWAAERSLVMEVAGVDSLRVDAGERGADSGRGGASPRRRVCDVLRIRMTPGLGFSTSDDLALYIDREEHLMRRVRFTLNGLESTQGAIAEIDNFDYVTRHGVQWPTRFHEQLKRPLSLPVHDWRLTGLDVNRGMTAAELSRDTFQGKAAAPAQPLPG